MSLSRIALWNRINDAVAHLITDIDSGSLGGAAYRFTDSLTDTLVEAFGSEPKPTTGVAALIEAVRWVLTDAHFKAPEQIGPIAGRWIDRLTVAMQDIDP